jgi:hypothetical protein
MAMTWRGPLAPLDRKDGAGRMVPIKNVDTDVRKLPLPLMYQQANWGGHNGAVRIGTIDRVWIESSPQRMLWGEGRFNEKNELARTAFTEVEEKYARHLSVDLDPGTGKLMGVTVVSCPAFEDAEIADLFRTPDDEAPTDIVDRMEPVAFSVAATSDGHVEWNMDPFFATPSTLIGDRGRAWDSSSAEKRIALWADGDPAKLGRAYMYRDPDKDPKIGAAYKLPYTDIVDGTLTVIPKAVFAIAAVLQGSRGGVDISDDAKKTVRSKVAALYRKMSKKFDEDLLVPWDKPDPETRSTETAAYAARTATVAAYQRFLHEELVHNAGS